MHRFPIQNYKRFAEVPLAHFDTQKFLVYILDFEWNYMFVNTAVSENLNIPVKDLIGKNMWKTFPELALDSDFQLLKRTMETGSITNIIATSPITGKKLSITGYRLEDCYYFSSTILPNKQSLMEELRTELKRKK
ncbi:MAG: hypothetical protein ACO1N7_11195 [Sphingobacteriaceae bacterium]